MGHSGVGMAATSPSRAAIAGSLRPAVIQTTAVAAVSRSWVSSSAAKNGRVME